MPVIQTNTWTCEVCGAIEVDSRETSMYSDPVVCPPGGRDWDHVEAAPGDWRLACPDCVAKHRVQCASVDQFKRAPHGYPGTQ